MYAVHTLVSHGSRFSYRRCRSRILSNNLRHVSTQDKGPTSNDDGKKVSSKTIERTTASSDSSTTTNKRKTLTTSSSILPGLALCAGTAIGGFQIASLITSTFAIPVSGIPTSILLGIGVNNSVSYNNDTFRPGITFATKTVLQTGIVCVAAKLSVLDIFSTGSQCLPVVLSSVTAGLVCLPLAGRLAGLSSTPMTLLLTAGTSICGVTAITALAPAIQASHKDIAVAVANTVAFGTIGMLAYPYLLHEIGNLSSTQIGMTLGVAIHDTSQVLGSAMSYKETFDDPVVLETAAVTKLVRNLGLAVAIPALTYYNHQASKQNDHITESNTSKDQPETHSGLVSFTKYVPPFVVAFLGMSAVRSTGDWALLASSSSSESVTNSGELWLDSMSFIGNDISKYLLGTAMAGVGLATNASSLKNVGWKPFAVGGVGALVVGGTGFTVAMLM